MKTWIAKAADRQEKWWLVDAEGKTLGRMASEIAMILRGKHKPTFTPNTDTGDFVVVINPEKVLVKGRKSEQKIYYRHTGFFGGLKETSFKEMLAKKPEDIVQTAVRGMLPKNKMTSQVIKKLKVYRGASHPHDAQNPQPLVSKLK